eukprot:SAG22_NODE_1056_length_5777_cov_137.240402_7_plen_60_part_00
MHRRSAARPAFESESLATRSAPMSATAFNAADRPAACRRRRRGALPCIRLCHRRPEPRL